jgi:hypothetical protein
MHKINIGYKWQFLGSSIKYLWKQRRGKLRFPKGDGMLRCLLEENE